MSLLRHGGLSHGGAIGDTHVNCPAGPTEQRRLVDAFIAAARQGDAAALEAFLRSDLLSTSAHAAAA
jgi:hypothetical protein